MELYRYTKTQEQKLLTFNKTKMNIKNIFKILDI